MDSMSQFIKKRKYSNVKFVSTVVQKPNLKRHVKSVHGNNKPFKCKICGYFCNHEPSLKNHVESVHEKEKTFIWEI